jgi:hypothetical protein
VYGNACVSKKMMLEWHWKLHLEWQGMTLVFVTHKCCKSGESCSCRQMSEHFFINHTIWSSLVQGTPSGDASACSMGPTDGEKQYTLSYCWSTCIATRQRAMHICDEL